MSDALTHSNDWMPTLLTLAEIKKIETNGVGLLPHLLRGKPVPDRPLFWRTRSARAVRQGPWKFCDVGKKKELYNLEDDPGETTNLAAEKPELVREFSSAWNEWNENVNLSAAKYHQ